MMRHPAKSFLLAWALLAPAAAVSVLPLCGTIFRCGCTMTSRYCNTHNLAGSNCSWCDNLSSFVLVLAASVAGASATMGLALKLRRPSVPVAAGFGVLGFWLTLSVAALVTAKLSGYPTWYGIPLE